MKQSTLQPSKEARSLQSRASEILYRQKLWYQKDPNNLQSIKYILKLDKQDRSKDQTNLLIRYFKKLQVFKELLPNDSDAYEQLTAAIEVEEYENGQDIIVEGDAGDTFYIILQGTVEVIKSQLIPIPQVNSTYEDENGNLVTLSKQQKKIKEYYEGWKEFYQDIHWSGTDITKEKVAYFLGIEENPDLDPRVHAQPLTNMKQTALYSCIMVHESQEPELFCNSNGQPCFPVNRSLVYLQQGAGFGELALMSDSVRITTCRADTFCSIGTLNRKNFAAILRRA